MKVNIAQNFYSDFSAICNKCMAGTNFWHRMAIASIVIPKRAKDKGQNALKAKNSNFH